MHEERSIDASKKSSAEHCLNARRQAGSIMIVVPGHVS
jgi:hypothetical protein